MSGINCLFQCWRGPASVRVQCFVCDHSPGSSVGCSDNIHWWNISVVDFVQTLVHQSNHHWCDPITDASVRSVASCGQVRSSLMILVSPTWSTGVSPTLHGSAATKYTGVAPWIVLPSKTARIHGESSSFLLDLAILPVHTSALSTKQKMRAEMSGRNSDPLMFLLCFLPFFSSMNMFPLRYRV